MTNHELTLTKYRVDKVTKKIGHCVRQGHGDMLICWLIYCHARYTVQSMQTNHTAVVHTQELTPNK